MKQLVELSGQHLSIRAIAKRERFGGLPRTCLYDKTKVVVLGRDAGGIPHWNAPFLDFALRVGFEARCVARIGPKPKGASRAASST